MQLKKFDYSSFDTFYPFLKTAFPAEELLPEHLHRQIFNQPNFYGRQYNNFEAFIIGYQFSDYLFFELYMVQEHLRGKGVGSTFLKTIIKEATTPIILEVELPTTDIAKRRIGFYKRLGFHLNTQDYKMPLFDNKHGGVPLYLMSYPNKLTQEEFEYYSNHIHKYVYPQV